MTVLRTALAAIDNAEAGARPEPPNDVGSGTIAGAVDGVRRSEARRRDLSEGEIVHVVVEQIEELDRAGDEYERRANSTVPTSYATKPPCCGRTSTPDIGGPATIRRRARWVSVSERE
jgi:hypothetical protein